MPNFLDALLIVQEKYQRRIERLYNLLSGNDEVLFIRHNHRHVSKEAIVEFCELIQAKFPKLNFTLIVWGYEDELGEDWGYPRIKTYQASKENNVKDFYENFFQSLNLIPL